MGYRIVRMSEDIFQQVLTEGFIIPTPDGKQIRCAKGLPPGAKIVDFSRDLYFARGEWALKVFHPDWEDAPPGNAIPEFQVEFTYEDAATMRVPDDMTTMEELARRRADAPHIVGG